VLPNDVKLMLKWIYMAIWACGSIKPFYSVIRLIMVHTCISGCWLCITCRSDMWVPRVWACLSTSCSSWLQKEFPKRRSILLKMPFLKLMFFIWPEYRERDSPHRKSMRMWVVSIYWHMQCFWSPYHQLRWEIRDTNYTGNIQWTWISVISELCFPKYMKYRLQ